MMGRKQILKCADEYDVIYAKKKYCYLVNHCEKVKKIKRRLNKRFRRELNQETKKNIITNYQ